MKRLMNMRVFFAVLAATCLIALLMAIPTRSVTPGQYDPWLDVTDDGKIDIRDIARVAKAFGTAGQNITKASLDYDSGWIDITDKQGQNITVTHGLNITDWNDENIDVSITGKTSLGGELQRYVGLAGQIAGWNKTYGGTDWDYARALVQTVDGGYALTGGAASFGAGVYDFWLVKTDASGNMQWNKTYGGTGNDFAFALVQTSDGGYALTGYTASFGAGGADVWLIRTDASGTMQWNKTYGGTNDDEAYALMQTSDGGFTLAGFTASFGAGVYDFWLIKTDVDGNAQWNKTYGGTNDDYVQALVQTADGGYALAGATRSFGAGGYDLWLVKTDASGTMQWNKTYGGTNDDGAYALMQTGDGGYALAGETRSFGVGNADSWLVKTDASGNHLWNKTYGGTNDDGAYALMQTGDGGYALAGYTKSFGAGRWDFWLVKTDASGNMQWNKTYGGTGDEIAFALVQTSDGGYTLAGGITSFGAGTYDFWLVKTSVESGLAWTDSSANTITLHRGATDMWWNFVRVKIWQVKNP